MTNESDNFLAQSLKQFQRFVHKAGPSASVAYTLLSAVLILGALGYYADKYFNSSPLFILVGLSLGLIIGFYELAKSIFKK
jgi:F0F1-type ATP synthase assembly protein I